jgi:hypothetical protein
VYIVICMWSAVCICNWLLIMWVAAYDHIIDLFHTMIYSVGIGFAGTRGIVPFRFARMFQWLFWTRVYVCVCSWLEHPIQIPDPIAAGIWSVAWWKITISYAGPPVKLNSPFRLSVEKKLWHLVLVVSSNWFPHTVLPFDSVQCTERPRVFFSEIVSFQVIHSKCDTQQFWIRTYTSREL